MAYTRHIGITKKVAGPGNVALYKFCQKTISADVLFVPTFVRDTAVIMLANRHRLNHAKDESLCWQNTNERLTGRTCCL